MHGGRLLRRESISSFKQTPHRGVGHVPALRYHASAAPLRGGSTQASGTMAEISPPNAVIVRRGFDRACKEFSELVAPLGFVPTRKRQWSRPSAGLMHVIFFHRCGSSYGAASNNSVAIRVHFSVHAPDYDGPPPLNGPSSDEIRDKQGRTYHTRFNALTDNAHDRCMTDIMRVVQEHGLPWFAKQRA